MERSYISDNEFRYFSLHLLKKSYQKPLRKERAIYQSIIIWKKGYSFYPLYPFMILSYYFTCAKASSTAAINALLVSVAPDTISTSVDCASIIA